MAKLQTERLIIREYARPDKARLLKCIDNLKVSKYLLVVPHPYKVKDAEWWLNHNADERRKRKARRSYNFAIELKAERQLIGGIGLSKVDPFQGTAEIGYWLGESYWSSGYMTEAIARMLEFAFRDLGLRRVDLSAFTENAASNHLALKFGFVLEGMKRKAVRSKADGTLHDENIYGLLKDDWQRSKDRKPKKKAKKN